MHNFKRIALSGAAFLFIVLLVALDFGGDFMAQAADNASTNNNLANNESGFWALLFDKGGVITWVIALLSAVGLPIIGIKIYQFMQMDIWRMAALEAAMQGYRAAAKGDAHKHAAQFSDLRHPTAALLAFAINEAHGGKVKKDTSRLTGGLLREEVSRRAHYLLRHLARHIWALELIATSAPLFGLLGTVLGMITAFQGVGAGSGADTGLLATGIWEALLTTAFGLAVALPFSICAGVLNNAIDDVRDFAEDALSEILVRGETPAA